MEGHLNFTLSVPSNKIILCSLIKIKQYKSKCKQIIKNWKKENWKKEISAKLFVIISLLCKEGSSDWYLKDKITARRSISSMEKQLVPSWALIEWAGDQHEVPSTAAAPKISTELWSRFFNKVRWWMRYDVG